MEGHQWRAEARAWWRRYGNFTGASETLQGQVYALRWGVHLGSISLTPTWPLNDPRFRGRYHKASHNLSLPQILLISDYFYAFLRREYFTSHTAST